MFFQPFLQQVFLQKLHKKKKVLNDIHARCCMDSNKMYIYIYKIKKIGLAMNMLQILLYYQMSLRKGYFHLGSVFEKK